VYTQPDRPTGRGQRTAPPAVAQWAKQRGLHVEQPVTWRDEGTREALRALAPDMVVVTAYGRILPKAVLAVPRLGAVNVHASLLPRWRGASPIQAAIAAGDRETGITTMLMDTGLDTGPMLLIERVAIEQHDDAVSLAQRLAQRSGPLLVETLARLERGDIVPNPQPSDGVTYAPLLRKEDGQRDWSDSAATLERLVRAYRPWPGVTLPMRGERVKVLRARAVNVEHSTADAHIGASSAVALPGTVLRIDNEGVAITCVEGTLTLLEVQAPSRPVTTAAAWANGMRLRVGDRLE
jgi:methionyl-tRNA formyltransferase